MMIDASKLTAEEKRNLQKKGNVMIKELNKIFPDRDIQICVEAVKRSNIDYQKAVEWILENPNFIPTVPTKKIGNHHHNNNDIKNSEKEEISEKKSTEKQTVTSPITPKKKYIEEIGHVRSILLHIPEQIIIDHLEKFKGDTGRTIEILLEKFEPPEIEENIIIIPENIDVPPSDDPVQKMDTEEYPDFLGNFRKCVNGEKINDNEKKNKSPTDSTVCLDSDNEKELDDPSSFIYDDSYYEEDDGIEISRISELPTEEEMLSECFVHPLLDETPTKPHDLPDLITKMYQEQSDEEVAKTLQIYGRVDSLPTDTTNDSVIPNYYRDYNQRRAKRFDPKNQKTPNNSRFQKPTIFVQPSSGLQSFLQKVEERSISILMGDVVNNAARYKIMPTRSLLAELREERTKIKKIVTEVSTKKKKPPVSKSKKPELEPEPLPEPEIEIPETDNDFFHVPNLGEEEENDPPNLIFPLDPYLSLQQEEIEYLKGYFTDNLEISECFPKRISISLTEPKKNWTFPRSLDLVLVVTFHPNYPTHAIPKFDIRSNSLTPQISPSTLGEMECFLNRKSKLLLGTSMIVEMVEIAETFLETYPLIGKEAVAALMAYKPPDTSGDYGESLKFIMDCKFTCSTAEELMLERSKIISQMEKKIPLVPLASLRILLQHFDWDTRKLLNNYSPNNSAESIKSLYEQAGIPAEDNSTLDIRISQLSHIIHECPSCLDDFPLSGMVTLNCNHLYCIKCAQEYATMMINEGKADCINCPGYKCKYIMDETLISSLVDNETYQKYVKFLSNKFIEKHPQIKWCPSKGCGLAIRKEGLQSGMVMCKCGFIWCWRCVKDGHWPASCEQIKWWNEVYAKDDSKISLDSAEEALSVRWLLQYTQDCPNCASPIQKNGGCNHMSCKKCGHQYCWVCLERWESSHYSCSNTNTQNADDRRTIISRIESNLTFRQFYLLNFKARQKNDRDSKNQMIQIMQTLIREKPETVDDAAIETVCKAVEFNYLARHILLHICVLGKYMQEKSIRGSKLLKPELKRLATSLCFLHACIDVHWKRFKISDVELAITGIKTGIKAFIRMFGYFIQQVKTKFDEVALLEIKKKNL